MLPLFPHHQNQSVYILAHIGKGKVWRKEDILLMEKGQVREYFSKLGVQKSIGPNRMHTWVLRDLADVIVRLDYIPVITATERGA